MSQLGPCVDLRANPGRVPQVGPLFSPGRAAEISARNRRVIVIDTETLKFKRMWGGYGNKPDDKDLGPVQSGRAARAAIPLTSQRGAIESRPSSTSPTA